MARATWGFPGFGIRGRAGGLEFLARKDGGTTVRAIPVVRAERTPLQRESEARLKAVAAAWKGLTIEEGEAWGRYVSDPHPALPQGGGKVPAQPYNAFSGLAAKCLQMRPLDAVPRLPPTTAFLGDGIVVSASPLPSGGEGVGGEGFPDERGPMAQKGIFEAGGQRDVPPENRTIEAPLTPAPLPRRGEGSGETGFRFSSSGANAEGVVTELMVQRLASPHRKPVAKEYRTARFVAFEAGSLTAEVPCESGAYALAVRFVRWDTGQETAVVPLGKVVVG